MKTKLLHYGLIETVKQFGMNRQLIEINQFFTIESIDAS